MKIKNIVLGALIFLSAFFMFGNMKVYAEKYSGQAIWPSEYISNIYIKKVRNDGYIKWQQARFIRRSEDNKFVYCIQPYTDIDNNNVYNIARSDWWTAANMTEAQWKRISLVAYYGYEYSGHTDKKWYAITQVMIWRLTNPKSDIFFTDTLNGNRISSYDDEIAEINALVDRHLTTPNIVVENNTVNLGTSITIPDTNGVLSDYTVTSSNNLTVSKSGNNLVITPNSVGEGTITFKKSTGKYDSYPVLYYVNGSQNVFRVGNYDPVSVSLKVKIIGGKLTLHKVDRDTGEGPSSSEATLSGASYGIYDEADNLVTTITTDAEGNVTSDYLPYLGIYNLKEISSSTGYELDNKTYTFEIKEDDLYPEMTVYEQIIKRPVKLHKYYAKADTGVLTPEQNIKFEFYNNKNELVLSTETDQDGYAEFILPYGTYTGKQITTLSGYIKVDDFQITVNENTEEVIHLSFTNAPVTAKLKVTKVDSESKLPLLVSNITFKIYDEEHNKYVCQTVTYPKKEEICEFKTDENGVFITPYDLITGNYSLEEITSPDGYLINNSKLSFRLDDETPLISDGEYGEYFEIKYENQRIKGQIEINKNGESFTIKDDGFTYESVPLKDIKIALYAAEEIKTLDGVVHYQKDELVKELTTNSEGKITFSDLYLGKYYLKETKTLDNYLLDTSTYNIELKSEDNQTEVIISSVKLLNYLKKGELEFTKTDLVNGDVIPNTKIEIYIEKDELIFSGLTDENGIVKIDNLPLGKYYIIETEPSTGYIITEDKVYFEIKENGEIVKAEMTNKPIYGTLEFTKTDISTSEPLPNTKIEIYTEKDELIFEGITDEEGKIIIEELRYGRYYILEKEAPEGYILNTEKMYFEILEDGEIVKCTMTNEQVIIEVPNTLLDDNHLVEILGTLLIIFGIGVLISENKRKK